jgi:hypothetical protein
MPAGGYFFDAIVRQEPIDEDKLNPADNCEEFTLLGAADVAHWRREIDRCRGETRAVVSGIGGTGFGDIALVPAAFLKHPKGIRDVSEWYVSLIERRDYVREIFEFQCDIAVRNLEPSLQSPATLMDVLMICGTDFGTQNSQFCSPATFDRLYAPYYRRVNDWIHRHTVEDLQAFLRRRPAADRPVHRRGLRHPQSRAVLRHGHGTRRGSRRTSATASVFWGGGVDTQRTLPFGTPAEVRAEVTDRLRIFSVNGGFVFNTIHNIQARTPVANIVAMIDAIADFNRAGA